MFYKLKNMKFLYAKNFQFATLIYVANKNHDAFPVCENTCDSNPVWFGDIVNNFRNTTLIWDLIIV